MSIKKLIASKPLNNAAIEHKIPAATLRKIDADLREILEAKAEGLKVPGSVRLRQYFIDTYNTPISTHAILRRLTNLAETKANGTKKHK